VKSIKTGFVVVVMLAVAYGVWVMLNKKPMNGQLTIGDVSWTPPKLDFGGGGAQPAPPASTLAPPNITPVEGMAMQPSNFPPATAQPPNVVAPTTGGGVSPFGGGAVTAPAPVVSPQEYAQQNPAPIIDASSSSGGSIYSGGGQLQPPSATPPSESSSYENVDTNAPASDNSSADRASEALGATGFLNAWRGAQDQLAQGELADALFTLSLWQDSPDVPADMQPQLVELLDQLAGHVIYSQEHLLEPPHEVRAGETLEDIAAQYEVPWQLLANINGIADPAQLQVGTSLKVVRGPFQAIISLERQELTLNVGRRYAGRFAIGVGNDPAPMTGDYSVREKEEEHTFYDREGRAIEPGAPENPYGPYWIGLGGRLAIHGAPSDSTATRESTGSIVVSQQDAADLFAILSKDSPVVIRR
jgi:lipoprotein-anchoring transpeptidase ErfK/SrfK